MTLLGDNNSAAGEPEKYLVLSAPEEVKQTVWLASRWLLTKSTQ